MKVQEASVSKAVVYWESKGRHFPKNMSRCGYHKKISIYTPLSAHISQKHTRLCKINLHIWIAKAIQKPNTTLSGIKSTPTSRRRRREPERKRIFPRAGNITEVPVWIGGNCSEPALLGGCRVFRDKEKPIWVFHIGFSGHSSRKVSDFFHCLAIAGIVSRGKVWWF